MTPRRPAASDIALPTGMRATRATRALLALLRSHAAQAWSAGEVEAALARTGVVVNRVTVFRALDRLGQAGLLRRQVCNDRITRYQWHSEAPRSPAQAPGAAANPALQRTAPGAGSGEVRFDCVQCGVQRALPAADARSVDAAHAAAFADWLAALGAAQLHRTLLQGVCAQCAPS